MTRRCKYGLSLALLATLVMGGCGIKPNHLSPPDKEAGKDFPRAYPQTGEK